MTPEQAYYKCLENEQRDKNLEKIIIKDSHYAFLYALNIIKDRWKEAEYIISTSSFSAYFYARNVIKGKLPENMHNMMLIRAMVETERRADDCYAKWYFDFIK